MAEELNERVSAAIKRTTWYFDEKPAVLEAIVAAVVGEIGRDLRLLGWLHAEAAWKRDQFQEALRQEREISEDLDKRGAYLEARAGELHNTAEQTVGTGYPQGSGPGHGSATPAPLSSRPQCAVHPEGGTA